MIRRARLEPLQYILGTQPFGALSIKCRSGVLIPRWETEEWVSKLAQLVPQEPRILDASTGSMAQKMRILDACTGSGCVSLLLNYELAYLRAMEAEIAAFDISETALLLAGENIDDYKQQYGGEVALFSGDVLDENVLGGNTYDLVVSNPPYVPYGDYKSPLSLNGVERSVRLYEPETALVGNFEFYDALVRNVVAPLKCKGFVFELGYTEQVERTKKMVDNAAEGWEIGQYSDSRGNVRCVVGWKPEMAFLENMCDGNSVS